MLHIFTKNGHNTSLTRRILHLNLLSLCEFDMELEFMELFWAYTYLLHIV